MSPLRRLQPRRTYAKCQIVKRSEGGGQPCGRAPRGCFGVTTTPHPIGGLLQEIRRAQHPSRSGPLEYFGLIVSKVYQLSALLQAIPQGTDPACSSDGLEADKLGDLVDVAESVLNDADVALLEYRSRPVLVPRLSLLRDCGVGASI